MNEKTEAARFAEPWKSQAAVPALNGLFKKLFTNSEIVFVVKAHSFRRMATRDMVTAGVRMEVIVAIGGWASYENAKKYIDAVIRKAANPLERLFTTRKVMLV